MDIEMGLLSSLLETGEIRKAILGKVTPDFFYGKGKEVYKFILKHFREYRKVPSLEAIQLEFIGFEKLETPEPTDYYIDQLRERQKYNIILEGINGIADKLKVSPAEAEILAYQLASRLSTEVRVTRDLNYASDIQERKDMYIYKKEHHGVDGIPTLIEPLDNVTGGAHGGELITILAQPGTGKTWLELVIVRAALKLGYRVLFITKEMEPEQLATRMDAALLGFEFDKVRRGLLGDDQEAEYFKALDDLAGKYSDFIISADEGEGGVTAIQAKIEEHHPDLVVIDGSYLIIDEDGGKSAHERATNITRRLKRMARKFKLPLYNSTQAGRQVKRSNAPDMEDVAFTYAYAQDSDVIISIYRTEEMIVAGKLGLKLTKVREGSNAGHFLLSWNFDDMKTFGMLAQDISDMGPEEDEETIIY